LRPEKGKGRGGWVESRHRFPVSFKVLVPQPIADEGIELLLGSGLEVVEPPAWDAATLGEYIGNCQGVLLRTAPMTRKVLERARDLRVIARHGVGLDNVDLEYCAERGIVVTNTPEANATAVAEHTLGMIVAVAKNMLLGDEEIRKGRFDARDRLYGIELEGKTLGVVGLGRIGRRVASKAAYGLGMKIVRYDPYLPGRDVPEFVRAMELEDLLATSDVVTLHLPLTEETRNLLGKERISAMKDGAYLVNCARGGIVDEGALEQALRSGKLSGAALDVFADEPTGQDHPLWDFKNVIVTPHMAAFTEESVVRMAVHAAEGVISVARGGPPRWPVNLNTLTSGP
jgi:D-3-phosphoglycerate dehydrogenase / 2-oxoglutarate reductase